MHDRGLDVSYMEAAGNQTVDLSSQFGTFVATHPHLQLDRLYSLPTPIDLFCGTPVPEVREVLRVTYF